MAQVQAVGASTTTSSVVINISASAAGNCLIVLIGTSSNLTVTSVSDNQGQSWSSAFSDDTKCHVFYKANTAAGVTQVTVTFPSSQEAAAIVMERDDLDTASPFDVASTQNSQSGVTTWTANATGTLAQDTALAIGIAHSVNGQNMFTGAGSGWAAITGTGITSGQRNNSAGASTFVELKDVTGGGTVQATGSCQSGADPYSLSLAFKKASAHGGVYVSLFD